MKIAVDLDDVCFEFIKGFAMVFGPPKDPNDVSLARQYPNLPLETIAKACRTEDIYYQSPPIDHAATVLNFLSKYHDLEYVSARPIEMVWVSKLSLCENNFPVAPVKLFGSGERKIAYIRDGEFDIAFDDIPETILGIAGKVQMPFVYSAPWNQSFDWCLRVDSWVDVWSRFFTP